MTTEFRLSQYMHTYFKITNSKLSVLRFAALTILLASLFGCETGQENTKTPKAYYDLKGFIESQIVLLKSDKPSVSKNMEISGNSENRTSRDIDWNRELELFVQADINKPAYSKSYRIEHPDTLTVVYTLKPGESLPVRFLKISQDKASGNPTMIQASLFSANKLYESQKDIELHATMRSGRWQLVSYVITGYQKLATQEKKPFGIKALVKY